MKKIYLLTIAFAFSVLISSNGCYTVLKYDDYEISDSYTRQSEYKAKQNDSDVASSYNEKFESSKDTTVVNKDGVIINNYNYYSSFNDDYYIYRRYFWDYYPGFYLGAYFYDPYLRDWYWYNDWYWRWRWYYPYASVIVIYNPYYWYWDYPYFYRRPVYANRSNSQFTRTRTFGDGTRENLRSYEFRNNYSSSTNSSNESNTIRSFRTSERNDAINSTSFRTRDTRTGWERENYNSIYREDRTRNSGDSRYMNQNSRNRNSSNDAKDQKPVYENPGFVSPGDRDNETRRGRVENRNNTPRNENNSSRNEYRNNNSERSRSESRESSRSTTGERNDRRGSNSSEQNPRRSR